MARLTRSRIGVVLVAAALAAGVVGVSAVRAAPAPPNLVPVPADRLLASSIEALADPNLTISGDVQTNLDLGLPDLPASLGGANSGSLQNLLGTQSWKLWVSPDGIRVAHLLDLQEQDAVANAATAWLWDSSSSTAIRFALPDRARATPPSLGDPLEIARRILRGIGPDADVSVSDTAWVAGRPVYTLVLTPRSTTTLVGSIRVAVDSETRLPLQIQVLPKASTDPAVEAGFTSVGFDAIDPSIFDFTPPSGTTVKDGNAMLEAARAKWRSEHPTPHAPSGAQLRTHERTAEQIFSGPDSPVLVFGSGFDLIVAVRVSSVPEAAAVLLPYRGPLASAIAVDRGDHSWIVAGLVPTSSLEAVAPKLP